MYAEPARQVSGTDLLDIYIRAVHGVCRLLSTCHRQAGLSHRDENKTGSLAYFAGCRD